MQMGRMRLEERGAQGTERLGSWALGFAASPGTASLVSWESCSGKEIDDNRNMGQTNPARAR